MFLEALSAVLCLWLVVVGCGPGCCHRCPALVVPFHAVVPVVILASEICAIRFTLRSSQLT